jgi:TatD DNase family protein
VKIGINLADPIFRGRYHGKPRHPDDLEGVIKRAQQVGCTKLIVTGSSFKSSRDALELASQFRKLTTTSSNPQHSN